MRSVGTLLRAATIFPMLLLLHLQADEVLDQLFEKYRSKQYKEVCQQGLRVFSHYKKDHKFLTLYGLACLQSDYIDRLAIPLTALRHNKEERENASYFATILLQKKLLYHALLDGADLTGLRLPKTHYVLSIVFDLFVRHRYRQLEQGYLLPSQKDGLSYRLYIKYKNKLPTMVIEEWQNGQCIQTHTYW